MNGFGENNAMMKKYIYAAVGSIGIIGLYKAITDHYKRLQKKSIKNKLGDASSEIASRCDVEVKKEVSEETIEKIVEKIKNSIIHTVCILIDKINEKKREINRLKAEKEKKDKKEEIKEIEFNEATSQLYQSGINSNNDLKEEKSNEDKNEEKNDEKNENNNENTEVKKEEASEIKKEVEDVKKEEEVEVKKEEEVKKNEDEDEIQIIEEKVEFVKKEVKEGEDAVRELNVKEELKKKEFEELLASIESKQQFLPDFEKSLYNYSNSVSFMKPIEILDYLIDTEKSIINSFDIKISDYQNRLKTLLKTNKKIQDSMNILNLYIQGLDKFEIFPLKFSKTLEDNYIKIISNIYYINITKTASKFKEEIIDGNKKDSEYPNSRLEKIFNDMYSSSLKETRNDVANFFGVSAHEIYSIPIKTLFRIYPIYLSEDHQSKKDYSALTKTVNKLLKFLEKKVVLKRFTDPNDEEYCITPKDKIYDFEGILKSLELNKDSQVQEILNLYGKQYKNEGNQEEEE